MRTTLAKIALLLAVQCTTAVAGPGFKVINGGFENGLSGWQATGDVHLETNSPLEGNASAAIGPGAGQLSQRIEIGGGNDFTLSAAIKSQRTNGWDFIIRFLDKNAHEIMRVDSLHDMERDKKEPLKFKHFMQAHPLTKWMEVVISKDALPGSVTVDEVDLDMTDENAADLKPICDLDQAMQPFWLGKKVTDEAVLMVSKDGKPATGRLMYQPSRIISVQDYGLSTNYDEGVDYTVDGRNLICTPKSRMTRVRNEDFERGEYKWNVVGGKQIMVTYEHEPELHPAFVGKYVGDCLPNTLEKLQKRASLTVVAYGDSITHGVGESRLSHVHPYLPPWPELFVHRLGKIYGDSRIQFFNSSQSGATSDWADKYAARMVNSLNPDLVIVAFGQNDFWSISADDFARNIESLMKTVRDKNPAVEFLLVSPLRFDPTYTTNAPYWNVVGDYAKKLKSMTQPGVQFVDMTAISEWVYAMKKPKDCMNDPLHPNDYFARWYAQSLVATLASPAKQDPAPSSGASSKNQLVHDPQNN